MEYIITKKYYSVRKDTDVKVQISTGGRKVNTPDTFFESDLLQEMIDNFINNEINDFEIPVAISYDTNTKEYSNPVYSDDIITSYKDGEPVYSDNVLTSYVNMTKEEITAVKRKKWAFLNYPIRFHVRLVDTYGSGSLASKSQEMRMKENPAKRVDSDHNINIDNGEWVDLYIPVVSIEDQPLVDAYLSNIEGSQLENLDEL